MLADPSALRTVSDRADPRDTNNLFELMYHRSMFYGRKGLAVAVISVIDLATWDLLGNIRNESVYKMIDGATRTRLDFYCTSPVHLHRCKGCVALRACRTGRSRKEHAFLKKHGEAVGPGFPLRVDCPPLHGQPGDS
jgi:L-rhamnonate dehydratase